MPFPINEPSKLPYGAVPFDRLAIDQFVPALDEALLVARANIAAIKENPQPATFDNTVVALEKATDMADHVATIYSNLRIANGHKELLNLTKEMMPRLIKLESDINLDELLFKRLQAAINAMPVASRDRGHHWSVEEKTLADRMMKSMIRNGALLSEEGKQRLRQIDDELGLLGPKFSENVLNATNSFELHLQDQADVVGIPPSILAVAAQTAKTRGHDQGWVFTLHAPSSLPFLRYAERRDLREKLWRALNSRGFNPPYDNKPIVKAIAKLKFERAKLLGFDSYAHYQLALRMAGHPQKVVTFMDHLLKKSLPGAAKELADLRVFMGEHGCQDPLMPWDYPYWAHKLKEQKYSYDVESTRPYFELSKVLAGAFAHAERLYDLRFTPMSGLPLYAPDVQVYKVTKVVSSSGEDGEFVGLFYTDFYSRPTKNPGAWCTRFRSQWTEANGEDIRPHVSIVCNFAAPTADQPCLLNFGEVSTVFHEFGHALHGLLSRCRFKSLSCTNVYRDFVELPSQIMENWLKHKPSLELFAHHHKTGELLPEELMNAIIAAENFHCAYMMVRQLRFGLLDFAWYHGDPEAIQDVAVHEQQALAATDLLPVPSGTNISCSFEHIFSGGYAAGYYGYKWAEVLDADAFELFLEVGIFSREVAGRFQRSILERGGTDHPADLYREFRGRDPDPDALLRRSGLEQSSI